MKQFLFCCTCVLQLFAAQSQESGEAKKAYTMDVSPFYGYIAAHNPDISHLVRKHPSGFLWSYNRKHLGQKRWESEYGYPDTGISLVYQDTHNPVLGELYGVYAHFGLNFLNNRFQARIGQGLAYSTNPYDRNTNFRNNAYGSHLLSSTYFTLGYRRENVINRLGFTGGLNLLHYSNANWSAPNTSTNTIAMHLGLIYSLYQPEDLAYIPKPPKEKFTEPVRYNLVLRGGTNQSDVIGMGQYGFLVFSGYADKRFSRKSAMQLGADVFLSGFLKEQIRFESISYPEKNVDPDTDYKRIGLFAGYELFVGNMSLLAQLGYYVYYPFDFEGRVYSRLGMKYYFRKKLFASMSLKSHAAKAEALEFGIGLRL